MPVGNDEREVYAVLVKQLEEQDAGDIYIIRATARWQWEHRVMPAGPGRGGGESFVMAWKRPTGAAQ